MEHGFTNDDARIAAARAFRDAAIADGWNAKPTYQHEAFERASTLERDGFIAMFLTREKQPEKTPWMKWKYEAKVSVWGPDGLAITVPATYDWNAIQAAVRRCIYCGAEDVATERIGFAGRACGACAPIERPKAEYPGWTN